jgi:tRNA G18 (ribose-2'-O)-methylase SpoU
MGVRELIFCNAEIDFNSPRLQRTSRNTHTTVPFRTSEAISTEIENYKDKDFLPVALELSNNSIPLQTLETPKKLLLILGNERHGISPQILEMVKVHTYIPLMGKNSSMNVVQAASIALYALTKL